MICKVSKKMVGEIRKMCKAEGLPYDVEFCTASPAEYKTHVDSDLYGNEKDYDIATGKFHYIAVHYPDDVPSYPTFLTTKILVTCLHNSDKTFDGFMHEVKNEIWI